MVNTTRPAPAVASHPGDFISLRQPRFVSLLFVVLTAIQAAGFLILGTGPRGCALAECIIVVANLVAIACVGTVFRRAQGVEAVFWFLFSAILMVWLVPNSLQTFDTFFSVTTLSDSTWRLLYCLYGAPILMILFLPDISGRTRVNSEIFLDLFQIGIVVALVYSTFFFLPARQMLPGDAFLRTISISDAQSIFLLLAVLVRLQFTRAPGARNLLLRFALFLFVCAVATFVGDWIDLHHYASASAWFNLAWNLNQAAPALIAITWVPEAEPQSNPEPTHFFNFLGASLILVAMLVTLNALMDRWKQANGGLLAGIAIAASLVAFTFRLALTQYHQQREIFQRKLAQEQLSESNDRINHLLDDSRRQTAEITQISELGSLLHACASREEVFRLIPERMRRLFPDASGSIALLTPSRNRLESTVTWGVGPAGQIFSPTECWALRRGTFHVHAGGLSGARCAHFLGEGASVCIPLIAIGEAFGVLSVQDNDFLAAIAPDASSHHSARSLNVATAVAEHVALAIANLGLRESLRVQAVRDPLTTLYNRRYMQEFLERELNSARRKHRPVAVMMLDIDHFKRYNDAVGHAAGDRLLSTVGEILLRSVRAEDIACRYGGEEFTLILPECSLKQAAVRAEIIRQRVAETCARQASERVQAVTISIGIAAFDETTDQIGLLLKFADDALYDAKRAGRNRVVLARPPYAVPEDNTRETAPSTSAAATGSE